MQRIGLEIGGEKAAEHLKDPRFKDLISAFETSSQALPDAIERYRRLIRGWQVLLDAIEREQPANKVEDMDVSDLKLAS
jgi:hypothetical protein